MKPLAFYLPQFHTFPENDEWWGKGFTEWTNTKKAKPLFEGHYQPHTPYNEFYYDLSDVEVMRKQASIAREYGLYGFCFYHYWFKDGKKLMEMPVENYLRETSIDLNYCLCWANEPWTRRWNGGVKDVIMPQEYGTRAEWEQHFNYLYEFFKDDRYIRIDDKPMLLIYRPEIMPCFDEMMAFWRELAKARGLNGLYIIAQGTFYCLSVSREEKLNDLDGYIMYEPGYTYTSISLKQPHFLQNYWDNRKFVINYFGTKVRAKIAELKKQSNGKPHDLCDYSLLWEMILKRKIPENYYPGAFTGWDNTARRGAKARICTGSTPELFEKFMTKQIIRARDEYQKDFLFITAWNEWAEGAHLEPDEKYGYGYLEALKNALIKTNEWPF